MAPVSRRLLVGSRRAVVRGAGDRRPCWPPATRCVRPSLGGRRCFASRAFARAIPHVLVTRRHRPIEGIVIHHCLGLDPRDVTVYRGHPGDDRAAAPARSRGRPHDVAGRERDARGRVSEAAQRRRGPRRCSSAANGRRGARAWSSAAIELHLARQCGDEEHARGHVPRAGRRSARAVREHGLEGEEVGLPLADDARRRGRRAGPSATGRPSSATTRAGTATARAAGYTVLRFTDVEIERPIPDGRCLARLLRCL